jgi:hypothetical protein
VLVRRWTVLFEVFLRGDDAEHLEAVALAVLDEVRRLEKLLSRYDPGSGDQPDQS